MRARRERSCGGNCTVPSVAMARCHSSHEHPRAGQILRRIREELSAAENRRFIPIVAGKANSFARDIQPQPRRSHKAVPGRGLCCVWHPSSPPNEGLRCRDNRSLVGYQEQAIEKGLNGHHRLVWSHTGHPRRISDDISLRRNSFPTARPGAI